MNLTFSTQQFTPKSFTLLLSVIERKSPERPEKETKRKGGVQKRTGGGEGESIRKIAPVNFRGNYHHLPKLREELL